MKQRNILRYLSAAAAAAVWSAAAAVPAGVTLNAGRVGAVDVPALAKFYQAAFGLQEVNRLNLSGGRVEIMLNFGATPEAAKANPAAQIVIMHRDSDELQDPVPHLILNVTDLAAVSAAVTAAGGKIGKPIPFGRITVGIATDPAGNQVELIQQPKN